MLQNVLSVLIVMGMVGLASAQPSPKPKVDDAKLVTKTYDLKPILSAQGKANGFTSADAVIKMIFETMIFEAIDIDEIKPGADGVLLIEREGDKLEVRAKAKTHEEIHDLIEAMVRLADLAVDVKTEVVEVDESTFATLQKELPKPKTGKQESPILFATGGEVEYLRVIEKENIFVDRLMKILKTGRSIQSSTARYGNGIESVLSARQSVLTFHQQVVNKKPKGPPEFVKEGFKLVGFPIVSGDRRFVRLKLTEQSVVLAGMKKHDLGEVVDGQKLVLTAPQLEDLGSTGSATVADGGTLLFRLTYAPKDKVWVVIIHPTIFIQAEEELKKQERK